MKAGPDDRAEGRHIVCAVHPGVMRRPGRGRDAAGGHGGTDERKERIALRLVAVTCFVLARTAWTPPVSWSP